MVDEVREVAENRAQRGLLAIKKILAFMLSEMGRHWRVSKQSYEGWREVK